MEDLVPEAQKLALLFYSQPPLKLTTQEFKQLIGDVKYGQYLNYFYGVTVEGVLLLVVQGEVRKERWGWGYSREADIAGEAYRRIYGATKEALLKQFRKEKDYPQLKSITLTELREFTYWLFKLRLERCDKARIASDIRKALCWLGKNDFPRGLVAVKPPLTAD